MSDSIPLSRHLADECIQLIRVQDAPNRQDVRQREDVRELEQEYRKRPESLHNSQLPNLVIEHERPEHRLMLLLKIKGMTNVEIAEKTGYSQSWISQVTRQPWFKTRLTEMLDEASEEVFEDLVKVEAKQSFLKLIDLRDTAKSEQVQLQSATRILEQCFGKPVQKTENTTNVFHVSTKLEDLDAQLRKLEEEERQLLGQGTVVGPSNDSAEPDRFKP